MMELLVLFGIVISVFAFFMGVFLLKDRRASIRAGEHRCDGGKTPTGCSHCGGPVRTHRPLQHDAEASQKDTIRRPFPIQNSHPPCNTRKDPRADR